MTREEMKAKYEENERIFDEAVEMIENIENLPHEVVMAHLQPSGRTQRSLHYVYKGEVWDDMVAFHTTSDKETLIRISNGIFGARSLPVGHYPLSHYVGKHEREFKENNATNLLAEALEMTPRWTRNGIFMYRHIHALNILIEKMGLECADKELNGDIYSVFLHNDIYPLHLDKDGSIMRLSGISHIPIYGGTLYPVDYLADEGVFDLGICKMYVPDMLQELINRRIKRALKFVE